MKTRVVQVATLVVGLIGCGDGLGPALPDPGPDAGVDQSQMIYGAPAAELATFCDWLAGRLGGYGRTRVCGAASLKTPAGGQGACVADFQQVSATCPLTLGEFGDCVNAAVMGPCPAGSLPEPCFNLLECAMPN
jgi:hypothetical protein